MEGTKAGLGQGDRWSSGETPGNLAAWGWTSVLNLDSTLQA